MISNIMNSPKMKISVAVIFIVGLILIINGGPIQLKITLG